MNLLIKSEQTTSFLKPTAYAESKRVHSIDQRKNTATLTTTQDSTDCLTELLPTLANLTDNQRWIMLVNCPYLPDSQVIEAAGINPSHILLINDQNKPLIHKIQASLSKGSCAATVFWSDENIDEWDIQELEESCSKGNNHCFILSNEQKTGQLTLI